jgi:hypothetical protein
MTRRGGKGPAVIIGMLGVALWGTSCAPSHEDSTGPSPVRIEFAGVGQLGIFDPSLQQDSGTRRLVMSYSAVEPSAMWPSQNTQINTRMAHSDDGGTTWNDDGTVNQAVDVALPLTPPLDAGTWVHEVSRVVHDPFAPVGEQWLLFWHRYLEINNVRHFEHGWIGLRTASAPTPVGGWSAERKLFAGTLYDSGNNVTIGPPEVSLSALHADLANCAVPTEPGALATANALYVSLYCAAVDVTQGRQVLLRKLRSNGNWEYVGTLTDNANDAQLLGYDGFSATELMAQGGKNYLMVSPENGTTYRGCLVFEIADLDTATLVRSGGQPVIVARINEKTGGFRGACGYEPTSASGIMYSEAFSDNPVFRIFMSFVRL